METRGNYDQLEDSAAAGIVIGVVDIIAILIVIAILCTRNFLY